jgi:hypothetical protein
MPELSPKTKQYQKQRLRRLMVQHPMISTLDMQRHLANDDLALDRAAGLKEACEAHNMFQMLFDAGVFKHRTDIGKRASHHYLRTVVARKLWIRNPTSYKSPIRSLRSVDDTM